MQIIQVHSEREIGQARELFLEYAASLNFSLSFQKFNQELAELPGTYAPPEGRLLLAYHKGEPVGCVALWKLGEGICEMKRLYLRPEFRGQKLGRRLVLALIQQARQIGYDRMRLDTVPEMQEALGLYRSLGFKELEPYTLNPVADALYMELRLRGDESMQTFDLGTLLAEREKVNRTWLEFLRVPSLSMGIYHLKAGQLDSQQPHTEDEVYYILDGRASFRAGKDERAVEPGTLIFVERAVEHRFSDVPEELTVLVFFAPPEGSLKEEQHSAKGELQKRVSHCSMGDDLVNFGLPPYLEMFAPPYRVVPVPRNGLAVIHAKKPTVAYYRFLYDAVGRDYDWTSRGSASTKTIDKSQA